MAVSLTAGVEGNISGHKFFDENANGLWDEGEITLEGWQIVLLDNMGQVVDSVYTDAAGLYVFADKSIGTYKLVETQQPDFEQTYPNNPDYYDVTIDPNGIAWTGSVDGVLYGGTNNFDYSKHVICTGNTTVIVDVYGTSAGRYTLTAATSIHSIYNTLVDLHSSISSPTITVVGNNGAPDNLDFGNTIKIENPVNGLTPGYWKNWKNHYTTQQFNQLLAGTFVGSNIEAAKVIFSKYSTKPGMELTMLKAHLLAAQLTVNLSNNPSLPNPDKAYLSLSYKIIYNGQSISVGEVINQALAIVANPSAYTRDQIIKVKDMLDYINNL